MRWLVGGALAIMLLESTAAAGPLENNLKLLRARAAAAKPKPAPRISPLRPRVSRARPRPAANRQDRYVSYRVDRFGSKAKGGDLLVNTSGVTGTTHVYVRTRLLSNGGNGQARVPDLAPGKLPIMVWSPESGRRRTYWVTIRPGKVAELDAAL